MRAAVWLAAAQRVATVALGACGEGGTLPADALVGADVACVTSTPVMLDFGMVGVGTSAAANTVTITNVSSMFSTGTLLVTRTGSNAADFPITADTCGGAMLAPGATCTFDVTFTPLAPGARSATVSVAGTCTDTATTSLTGTAVAPATLALAPPTKDFGSVSAGATGGAATFTLTNTGDLPTSAVTAAISSEFEIVSDTCSGSALAAHGSCTIDARFAPTSIGNKPGTLTLMASTGGQASSMLFGTGTTSSNYFVMNPMNLVFPATTVGAATSAMTINVTWNGAQPTGTIQTVLTGMAPADFDVVSDTCAGTSLVPAGQCTIEITFRPSASGTRQAAVYVSANPGATVTAALQGSGQ